MPHQQNSIDKLHCPLHSSLLQKYCYLRMQPP